MSPLLSTKDAIEQNLINKQISTVYECNGCLDDDIRAHLI